MHHRVIKLEYRLQLLLRLIGTFLPGMQQTLPCDASDETTYWIAFASELGARLLGDQHAAVK